MFKGEPKTEYHGDHFFCIVVSLAIWESILLVLEEVTKNPMVSFETIAYMLAWHLQVFWLQHQHYE
jgi:hypothetical protein